VEQFNQQGSKSKLICVEKMSESHNIRSSSCIFLMTSENQEKTDPPGCHSDKPTAPKRPSRGDSLMLLHLN